MDSSNIPIKEENDGHRCQFCTFCTSNYEEYKIHTFDHFTRKSCSVCNVHLIRICDEWFEVHREANCHNSNHTHEFNENHTIVDSNHSVSVVEVQDLLDPSSAKAEVRSQDFGEIFAANLNTLNEVVNCTNLQVQNVVSAKEIKNSTRGSTEIMCRLCDKKYNSGFELHCHIQSYHGTNNDKRCKHCLETFQTFEKLEEHLQTCSHNNVKRVRIRANPSTERNKYEKDFKAKERYHPPHPHRPVSNITCDICHRVLANYYSLKEHMRAKHSKESMNIPKCEICGRTFASKRYLEKHEHLVHKKPLAETTLRPNRVKIFQKHMCSVCGRIFPDKSKMLSHEKNHQGIMESCEVCSKQFKSRSSLSKHIKLVHGERPFPCNVDGCEWTFAYPQCLQRHQARRHGMVKNRNACPICSKEFPDSTYHLKRHLKAHANNTAKEYIPEQNASQQKRLRTK